ncbi:MAG: peptide-methionine (S)-S-oxide reductase MsrA [Rhodospirillales bacterium]|nr:peptide-methionine (S)-S-oxide reductase MsrA [Alphaproteobacteria bacterium]MCB9986864.1 peptide-methionine (S)-S-oxide reductase MsrA [Rhodospirillales bacterium]USO08375.1 MAG: peptide-methionine (S)-S-oxide reductase MsrA [Rhodospirillales bacterium]
MRIAMILGLAGMFGVGTAQAAEVKTVLAAGCFWSMQKALDHAPGVTHTVVGYSGGDSRNPTYDDYHDGPYPHVEAVEVTYDTGKTSYAQLLDYYFHAIDPTDGRGQFCDFGPGYKPVIFVKDAAERETAQTEKTRIAQVLGKPVAVEIRDAATFWPAEDYHQDYYKKNPAAYAAYRVGCGRDIKHAAIWAGHE